MRSLRPTRQDAGIFLISFACALYFGPNADQRWEWITPGSLLGTLLLVQFNLLRQMRLTGGPERPNLVLFDIQPDQRPQVERLLKDAGLASTAPVPIVPMRIASVKGTPVSQILGDTTAAGDDGSPGAWAFRREYRSTYRDTLVASERLTAGRWWERRTAEAGAPQPGVEPRQVAADLRPHVRIHQRRARALELGRRRHHLVRQRHHHPGQLLRGDLARPSLVPRAHVGEEEHDRERVDALLLHAAERAPVSQPEVPEAEEADEAPLPLPSWRRPTSDQPRTPYTPPASPREPL